jgi:DNA polymerase III epsilon subunit-like protein
MEQINYIIFDLETSDKDSDTCYPLQVAATAVDGKTLEVLESFQSFMRPNLTDEIIMDLGGPIKPDALRVNHIKREDILKFPLTKVVWPNFIEFCLKYRVGKTIWGYPIPVGYNIVNFDIPIVKRVSKELNTRYPFHTRDFIDLMNLEMITMGGLTGESRMEKYSFDYVKGYYGMNNEEYGQSHDAQRDVKDTLDLFIRKLRWIRTKVKLHNDRTPFRNSFNVARETSNV